jgi:hypothetical protein
MSDAELVLTVLQFFENIMNCFQIRHIMPRSTKNKNTKDSNFEPNFWVHFHKGYRLVRKSNHPFLVLKGVTEM